MIDFSDIPITVSKADPLGRIYCQAQYVVGARVSVDLHHADNPDLRREVTRRLHYEMWRTVYGQIFDNAKHLALEMNDVCWYSGPSKMLNCEKARELFDKFFLMLEPPKR